MFRNGRRRNRRYDETMIVEANGVELKCNLLIADNGICQIFVDGIRKSIDIQSVNIKKIIVVNNE